MNSWRYVCYIAGICLIGLLGGIGECEQWIKAGIMVLTILLLGVSQLGLTYGNKKRINKDLKKGIKEAQQGKVVTIERIEDLLKKDKREKYLYYRVYLYFYGLFWQLIRLPGDVRRNIRDFFQRGRRGWANSDTWGFDYYLSKVLLGGMEHLEKDQNGMPTWAPGKTELEATNEWDCILNTMINTFRLAKGISEGDIYHIPLKDFTVKEYKKLVKFSEKTKHHVKVLNRKETEEFEKGFDLFKEHFFSLWD